MSFSSITRSQYRPIGRQPFRPGQWQGYKAASNHTTYIQNNFFGSGYNTGFNYDYNYGSCCHHDDGGMSKGMKWLLGIGLGTTLLGGILKMFGVGGGKETGSATPAQQQTNNDAVIARNTPAPTQQTPEQVAEEILEETTQEEPPTQEEGAQEENSIKWNDLSNMVCRDASGKTQNISGKFNITQAGEEGQPPKEFTITDTSSGTPHTYTYELTGTTSDGKPLYTCKSMNGQTASQNEYTLETKEDGTPELVQHKGQENFSKGLTFGSIASQTPTPAATAPAEEQIYDAGTLPEVVVTPKPDGTKIGAQVARDLVGYTTDSEKARVIKNISKNLDSTNIQKFLNSYNENKGLGDSIMKQINTEYGWTNKEKLDSQKQILNSLLEKANDEGIKLGEKEQEYCTRFLNTNSETTKISDTAASNLDKIIAKIMEQLNQKA